VISFLLESSTQVLTIAASFYKLYQRVYRIPTVSLRLSNSYLHDHDRHREFLVTLDRHTTKTLSKNIPIPITLL
jgi:hypothetical protein